MSYCRWSSDNWKCDVYVYEDVNGGWTTHVAGRRRLKLDTLPQSPYDLLTGGSVPENWNEIYRTYHDALGKLPFEDITLPHAGDSFNDPMPSDCADRLETLRGLGYHVPQYAIDELRAEQAGTVATSDPGAREKALEEAAMLCEKEAKAQMDAAEEAHESGPDGYDEYERRESRAVDAQCLADAIRALAAKHEGK